VQTEPHIHENPVGAKEAIGTLVQYLFQRIEMVDFIHSFVHARFFCSQLHCSGIGNHSILESFPTA
jgi:hypothetical protein